MDEEAKTYSVGLRLRRIICEDGYVGVPVTDRVIRQEPDGSGRLDGQAVFEEAVRLGQDPRVEWRLESSTIQIHPVQGPRPADRATYDPFIDYVDEKPN